MPQSRHRKIDRARKKPKGAYASTSAAPLSRKNRSLRIIAIAVVVVLALAAIGYLFKYRPGGSEITTSSGLRYTDNEIGTGPTPQRGQTVTVHYSGFLENGTKFDSSYDRGSPANYRIGVGEVIKGWDEGLMSMKKGGKRRLVIPPYLAYGPAGRPPNIPGNATLVFDVELVDVK